MTVNGISQTFSFTAVRLSVSDRSGPAAIPAKSATSTVEPDRVTLSTKADAVSRVERRANALFGTLDADQDGAITEQEFTEGAIALLRRAGDRRRARGDEGDERESHGVHRLERTLEKAFGRVDSNDDGAIDTDELTIALARVAKRRGGRSEPAQTEEPQPAQEPAQPPQTGTTVTFTFAFVSVAVQRYTSVQSSKDLAQEAPKDVPKPPLEAPAEAAGSEPTDASLEPRRAA